MYCVNNYVSYSHTHTLSKPLILLGCGGRWSLSQRSLGKRQETPWTGCQSNTGQVVHFNVEIQCCVSLLVAVFKALTLLKFTFAA